MKKIIALVLALVLTVAASVAGTVAYLQSEDSDVNVMTLGNVEIEQIEQEYDADGKLVDFTQAKPLYPYVGELGWKNISTGGGAYRQFTMENVVDKYVSVKNTGKSDAYVRTVIALEMGDFTYDEFEDIVGISINAENGSEFKFPGTWEWTHDFVEVIDGNNYNIMIAVHENPVKPDETTIPSLLQVYLSNDADNEEVAKLDGNDNGTYDILVVSQAVQTAGFENAAEALEAAFPMGANNENVPVWFTGEDGKVEFPEIFAWEGVNYITTGDTVKVSSGDGDTVYRGVLSDGKTTAVNVVIGEGITRLNDRALCKAPTIASVTLPSTLDYIDEGVFQQSGITSIEIPENVTYIGKQAMGACGSLETIVIKAKNVTIANYVARACANLKEVYIYSDSVTFESGSMYFTNKENADASGITFYVPNQAMADNLHTAFSTSHSYGLLIKSLDGTTEFYNTLK